MGDGEEHLLEVALLALVLLDLVGGPGSDGAKVELGELATGPALPSEVAHLGHEHLGELECLGFDARLGASLNHRWWRRAVGRWSGRTGVVSNVS